MKVQEFCKLLGVKEDNALVVNIYNALMSNGYVIVRQSDLDDILNKCNKVNTSFQDYTVKNNNNLTGT